MGAFDLLRIAGSSLGMHQTWLDALANNIANVNTVTSTSQSAFQAQMPIVQRRARRRRRGDRHRARATRRAAWSRTPTTRWPTRTATSAPPTSTSPAR